METALIIWMIGVLPGLSKGFTVIAILGIVFGGLAVGFLASEGYDIKKRYVIPAALFFLFCIGFGAIIPDKQTMYAMVAGYGVQKAVESPRVQEVASDAGDVLSAYLKKIKKELEEGNK